MKFSWTFVGVVGRLRPSGHEPSLALTECGTQARSLAFDQSQKDFTKPSLMALQNWISQSAPPEAFD